MKSDQPPKKRGRPRGRPINVDRQQMESSLGVSARRVQQLISELGLDKISDMGELRLREKRIVIALRGLQARREEHDLTLAKRMVIPADEVRRLGRRIGEMTQAALTDIVERAATECAGCTELQIFGWMRLAATDCINNLLREVRKLVDADQA